MHYLRANVLRAEFWQFFRTILLDIADYRAREKNNLSLDFSFRGQFRTSTIEKMKIPLVRN